mmetsp:Transcript_12979/g.24742  ORF Transcript_12979/g.24742 Transcript_12979/m.24742 type:complete len:677 (+) Transcript_12979:110-2140(+)
MANNDQIQAQRDSYLQEWKTMLNQSTTFQQRTMLSSAASKPAQAEDSLHRTPWAMSKVDQLELDYEEFSVPGGSIASRQLRSRGAQKPSDSHQGSEAERVQHVQDQGPSAEQTHAAAPPAVLPAAAPVSGVPERLANLPDPSIDDDDKMAKRRKAKVASWMLPWRCPGMCAYLVVLLLLFGMGESTFHVTGTTTSYPQKVLTALSAAAATFQSALQDASPPPLLTTSSPTLPFTTSDDAVVSASEGDVQMIDQPNTDASGTDASPSSSGDESISEPPTNENPNHKPTNRDDLEATEDEPQKGPEEDVQDRGNGGQEGDSHNDVNAIEPRANEPVAGVEVPEADRDVQGDGGSGESTVGGESGQSGEGNSGAETISVREDERQDEAKDQADDTGDRSDTGGRLFQSSIQSPVPPSPSFPAAPIAAPTVVVKHMGTTMARGGDSNDPVIRGKGSSEFEEEVLESRLEGAEEGVRERRAPSPWAHDEGDGFVKARSHKRRRAKRAREAEDSGENTHEEGEEDDREEEAPSKIAGKGLAAPVAKQGGRGDKEGGWRGKNPDSFNVAAEENADEFAKEKRTKSKPKPLPEARAQPVRHTREILPGAMTNFHWERALPEPARSKRRRSPSTDDVADLGVDPELKRRRTSKPSTTSIEEVASAAAVRKSSAKLRGASTQGLTD